jgi:hypothetical protein
MPSDNARYIAAQRQPVLDHSICVIEKPDRINAGCRCAIDLLFRPQGARGVGVHAIDSRFTAGDQEIADPLGLRCPSGDGARRAVLEIIRMGNHGKSTRPIFGDRL